MSYTKEHGAWDSEPDSLDFEHCGLKCSIRRMPNMGHLCGYVSVSDDHPWYGKTYDDRVHVPKLAERQISMDKVGAITMFCASALCDIESEQAAIVLVLEVHGGITYSGRLNGDDGNLWWFGFDCSHCDDLQPHPKFTHERGVYRNFEYVKTETQGLAEQLAKITGE